MSHLAPHQALAEPVAHVRATRYASAVSQRTDVCHWLGQCLYTIHLKHRGIRNDMIASSGLIRHARRSAVQAAGRFLARRRAGRAVSPPGDGTIQPLPKR